MISPEVFLNALRGQGIDFFCGVPDSLLKNLCACIDDSVDKRSHIITANEGNAVALAAGYHLATGKVGAVYMQNSGLGNSVNPLTSLTDPQVYNIPLLLIIGWRGEPGVKDEPQHVKQGRISAGQLDILEIPYLVIDKTVNLERITLFLSGQFAKEKGPAALLVRADTFSDYKSKKNGSVNYHLTREDALAKILELNNGTDLFVSTTGKTSQELFELRVKRNESQRDFLTVGSMGHTSSIALGVALGRPDKRVICLDGDGSVLMHMGSIPIIGDLKPFNFIHVVLNNASHESVGGQPTVAGSISFEGIAESCGYNNYFYAENVDDLSDIWSSLQEMNGPSMVEIRIKQGSRADLGRPTSTPEQNKKMFMDFINV